MKSLRYKEIEKLSNTSDRAELSGYVDDMFRAGQDGIEQTRGINQQIEIMIKSSELILILRNELSPLIKKRARKKVTDIVRSWILICSVGNKEFHKSTTLNYFNNKRDKLTSTDEMISLLIKVTGRAASSFISSHDICELMSFYANLEDH